MRVPLERLGVGTYLTQWLETVKPRLRPEAYRRYEEMVRLQIKPEIGSSLLARLTPQQVQTAYVRRLGAGLSPTSVQLMHGILHKALDQASQSGMIARNVTDLAEAPRRSTTEVPALSVAGAGQLFQAARGDRLEALYVLPITCVCASERFRRCAGPTWISHGHESALRLLSKVRPVVLRSW